jgi:hypothetical protein
MATELGVSKYSMNDVMSLPEDELNKLAKPLSNAELRTLSDQVSNVKAVDVMGFAMTTLIRSVEQLSDETEKRRMFIAVASVSQAGQLLCHKLAPKYYESVFEEV